MFPACTECCLLCWVSLLSQTVAQHLYGVPGIQSSLCYRTIIVRQKLDFKKIKREPGDSIFCCFVTYLIFLQLTNTFSTNKFTFKRGMMIFNFTFYISGPYYFLNCITHIAFSSPNYSGASSLRGLSIHLTMFSSQQGSKACQRRLI